VLKSGEGAYMAGPATLSDLGARGQVVARYAGAEPEWLGADIAGICNEAGNVVGLMPHPEHAIDIADRAERGRLGFFTSILLAAARA